MDTRNGNVRSIEAFADRIGRDELERLVGDGFIVPVKTDEMTKLQARRMMDDDQPVVRAADRRSTLAKKCADDPVVKIGENGPMRVSDMGWNRTERRQYMRALIKAKKRTEE